MILHAAIFILFVLAQITPASAAPQDIAGEWMITVQEPFGSNTMRLSLAVAGEQISGRLDGRKIEGTVRDGAIEFKMGNNSVKGTLQDGSLRGEAVFPDRTVKWTAV